MTAFEIDDTQEFLLDEEGDAAPLGIRGLVTAGGRPFILITVVDDAGGVNIEVAGIEQDKVVPALRECAALIEADLGVSSD